jgi:hypothetical protein
MNGSMTGPRSKPNARPEPDAPAADSAPIRRQRAGRYILFLLIAMALSATVVYVIVRAVMHT